MLVGLNANRKAMQAINYTSIQLDNVAREPASRLILQTTLYNRKLIRLRYNSTQVNLRELKQLINSLKIARLF